MIKIICSQIFIPLFLLMSSCNPNVPSTGIEPNPAIDAKDTTLELSPSVPSASASINAPVTFTAILKPVDPYQTRPPKGSVTFTINRETVSTCQAVPLNEFLTAECEIKFQSGGNFEVSAFYGQDEHAYKSSYATINYYINKIKTSLDLDTPASPAAVGTIFQLNVTLSNGGNINFQPQNYLTITDKVISNTSKIENKCTKFERKGNAYSSVCTYQILKPGVHTISILYPEDQNNEKSSTGFEITLNPIKPTLQIQPITSDSFNVHILNIIVRFKVQANEFSGSIGKVRIYSSLKATPICPETDITISKNTRMTQDITCLDVISGSDVGIPIAYRAEFTPNNPDYFKFIESDPEIHTIRPYIPTLSFPNSTADAGDTLTLSAIVGGQNGISIDDVPIDGLINFEVTEDPQDPNSDYGPIEDCTGIAVNNKKLTATCEYTVGRQGKYYFKATYTNSQRYNNIDAPRMIEITPRIPKIDIQYESINPLKPEFKLTAIIEPTHQSLNPVPAPSGTVTFKSDGNEISGCTRVNVAAIGMDRKKSTAVCDRFDANQRNHTIGVEYTPDANSFYGNKFDSITLNVNNIPIPTLSIQSPYPEKYDRNTKEVEYIYNRSKWTEGKLSFDVTGNWFNEKITDISPKLTFHIDSITVLEDYNLEIKNEAEEKPSYTNPSKEIGIGECTRNEAETYTTFSCPFRPIVAKFLLNTTLSYERPGQAEEQKYNFYITFLPPAQKHKIGANNQIPDGGCGLLGTTRQRMFDCSMLVEDYTGSVKYDKWGGFDRESYVFYADSNTKKNWYLVNCPRNGKSSECAWLSPELQVGNPATSANEFLSYNYNADLNDPIWKMESYTKTDNPHKRILWSGQFPNTYGFWDINSYLGYRYQDVIRSDCGIYSYCESFANTMQKHKGQVRGGAANSYTDYCQQSAQNAAADKGNIWLDAEYDWRVPSYPQIMTLTGAPQCNGGIDTGDPSVGNGTKITPHLESRYQCLDVDNGVTNGKRNEMIWGFSASLVPGFYKEDTFHNRLWSSSLATLRKFSSAPEPSPDVFYEKGWGVSILDGHVDAFERDREKFSLRCASMDW